MSIALKVCGHYLEAHTEEEKCEANMCLPGKK